MRISRFLSKFLNRRGQSIVEITLITPLVLVALYIPADFGIAFMTAHLAQNAVREAARIGASQDPFAPNAVEAEGLSRMPAALTGADVNATLVTGANCAAYVEVVGTGSYNYFLYQVIRLIGFSAPDTRPITRTARMRYEYQPITNSTPCTP